MEIDLMNDILTSTVGYLFKGNSGFSYQMGNQQFDKTIIRKDEQEYLNSYNVSNDGYSNFTSNMNQSQAFGNKTLKVDTGLNSYMNSIQGAQKSQPNNKAYNSASQVDMYLQKQGQELLQLSFQNLNLDINKINRLQNELDNFDLNAINEQKKKVKKELKNYDIKFQMTFNRMPNRNEKEPMRPLYIYYKKLKQQLEKIEKMGQQKQKSYQINNHKQMNESQIMQKLAELKKKRNQLREFLHNYQKEFTRSNNRKIRYQKDIQAVEQEYNDYKVIKQQIQELEGSLQS